MEVVELFPYNLARPLVVVEMSYVPMLGEVEEEDPSMLEVEAEEVLSTQGVEEVSFSAKVEVVLAKEEGSSAIHILGSLVAAPRYLEITLLFQVL